MTRLNARELAAMNNRSRRWMQRAIELPLFARMLRNAHIDLSGKRILDAGCGSAYSTQLIARRWSPSRLVAFDLMPEQIALADERNIEGAELTVGDITAIAEEDASFDAAFVFGILHHVPAWRDGLCELSRVLAPGGALLVEELHGRFVEFEDRVLGMSHPKAARFDWPTFRTGLDDAGLTVVEEHGLANAARSFLCIKR